MPVYRPRAGQVDGDGGTAATAESVILPEEDGRYTGLLDAQGVCLFRFRDPVGFDLRAKQKKVVDT